MDAVVSLFAGAGGLSSGFSAAGAAPTIAAEIDPSACATYETNLGLAPIEIDLGEQGSPSEISKATAGRPVLAVIGGPPCQGFSTAGLRSANDPRNRLIFNYFAVVDALRPRWFLFENVEGLLTSGDGEAVISLVRLFIERGYSVRLEKVNFASFGLPQARKRVVLIGNRLGMDFRFPTPSHAFNAGKHQSRSQLPQGPTLLAALAGLGPARTGQRCRSSYASALPASPYDDLMRRDRSDFSLHYWSASALDKRRYPHLKPGQTMKDLPPELWHSSFKRRAFRRVRDGTPTEKRGGSPSGLKRLRGDYCSLTITSAATREFIHPLEDRPLTLREAARLQSFHDQYEFVGADSAKAKQIGNAFPPLAATLFAEHLLELDGLYGSGRPVENEKRPHLIGFNLTDASGMSPALRRTHACLSELCGELLPFDVAREVHCNAA